ncbi:Kinesin-like protein kif22, partial [Cladochytrium tenue]
MPAPARRRGGSGTGASSNPASLLDSAAAAATDPCSQKVQVIVRLKPLANGVVSLVTPDPDDAAHAVRLPGTMPDEQLVFPFDAVLGERSSQADVFEAVGAGLLARAMQGRNATVFAYGQTGAGKTHTIVGKGRDDPGLLPRVVRALLDGVATADDTGRGSVAAAWLECYQDKLYDLRNRKSALELYGDRNCTKVQGLSFLDIKDFDHFQREHDAAWKARATAATRLNVNSSRSHFVLQLNAIFTRDGKVYTPKLNICDLAGSENNKRTGNSGERMNESKAINRSLFELGRVVEALNRGQANVSYRNSVLTRLLQDALGGSAYAAVLACLSGDDLAETLSTLKFGAKCRTIQNTVVV